MKIATLLLFLAAFSPCSSQVPHHPGRLEFHGYRIGQQVDTSRFKKYGDIYCPNYLDGWSMENLERLPKKYSGLPIAMWIPRHDTMVALTLIGDIVLNMMLTGIPEPQKNRFIDSMEYRFGAEGEQRTYIQRHLFQTYMTFWNLKTWKARKVIVQIGSNDTRNKEDAFPDEVSWELVYSDLGLEDSIVKVFKKKMLSNREDSLQYIIRFKRANPPRYGLYTDYHENGLLKTRGNYAGGRKVGVWETWYANGQKKDSNTHCRHVFPIHPLNILPGEDEQHLVGYCRSWYASGRVRNENTFNSLHQPVGVRKTYYDNGQVQDSTTYDNKGRKQGLAVEYYENGNKKHVILYEHDAKLWEEFWYESGNGMKLYFKEGYMQREIIYEQGKVISDKTWP